MYYVKCLGQQCISAIKIINYYYYYYYYYYWILQLRQGFIPRQLHIQYLPMNVFSILAQKVP